MRIVNENLATRRLAWREREDDDPRNPVVDETVVEFDAAGRAEIDDELGAELVAEYEPIREADGPDDVADQYEPDDPWADVRVDATDEAAELGREQGVEPSELTGSGEDGRILVGDVENALDGRDGGDA